jgi:chemotaxis protein MotB
MARMPKRLIGLAAVALAVSGGCVSQEKYNALKMDRDRLTEQLSAAQNEANVVRREAELYKASLDAIKNGGQANEALVASLTAANADLQRQLDDMNKKYGDAMNKFGTVTALPAALTSELQAFANANPELVEFDSQRGIVKFKSDLTFALGSAELKPEAKAAIGRFAQILNSGSASGYELLVAGHTDNVRVSNPATIQAGHKDNWFLSSHRAISVVREMLGGSVSAQRLGAVGYADQRPVADNTSEGGRARNRRVEVLILPTTVRSAPVASARPAAAPRRAEMNKDTAATDVRSTLNK